jgi:hypothetical protein
MHRSIILSLLLLVCSTLAQSLDPADNTTMFIVRTAFGLDEAKDFEDSNPCNWANGQSVTCNNGSVTAL